MLNCAAPSSLYVELLTPSTSRCSLICKQVAADVISYNEVLLEKWGPLLQYDWCSYKKGKFGDTHTQGEPGEDEGRDWCDFPLVKADQSLPVNPQEGGKRRGVRSSSQPPERTDPPNALTLDISPPEA